MQIGLECFMDEQISSMIASENRHGECEIQGKKECIVYDTNEDHYLEGYLEEIMDAFTVAKQYVANDTKMSRNYLMKKLQLENYFQHMKWSVNAF